MTDSNASDDVLTAQIAPDVMRCLASRGFFEELDNHLCPTDSSNGREYCGGNHEVSKAILRSKGFDESAIGDVCAVLEAQGGFCDCEILYNVVETCRLKAEY
jgi:hypothetical protein